MFRLKINIPVILLFLSMLTSCGSLEKSDRESSNDFWSKLVAKSEKKKVSILEILKVENPHLYRQIEADANDPLILSFWGKSYNFDSGAKKQIISDAIISDLQNFFKISSNNKIVHAGVTHTYGYLFSVLETPYGYKRKRWVEPTLNYGFALSGSSLSPKTVQGTMLSNLTYFAGKIAFQQASDRQSLDQLKNVASEIKNFDYSRLQVTYVEEEINQAPITLRTALVKLPFKRAEEENDSLLIYSIWKAKEKIEELITVFPIKKEAFLKIIDPAGQGKNQSVSLRYNAFFEGLSDQKLTGTRKIR